MLPCCVCGNYTSVVVNIRLRASPVCNACCLTITKQTVCSLRLDNLTVDSNDGPEVIDTAWGEVVVGGEA